LIGRADHKAYRDTPFTDIDAGTTIDHCSNHPGLLLLERADVSAKKLFHGLG
jgi:hypothetical protein